MSVPYESPKKALKIRMRAFQNIANQTARALPKHKEIALNRRNNRKRFKKQQNSEMTDLSKQCVGTHEHGTADSVVQNRFDCGS